MAMTSREPVTKWCQFSDAELRVLWDELRIDDGIAYGISESDGVVYGLARGILTEAQERGLELPDADTTL